MVNKWITLVIVLVALYSFIKNPPNYTVTPEDKQETHELIEKLKNYIDVLSVSPKNQSLTEEKNDISYKDIKIDDIAENPNQTQVNSQSNLNSAFTQNPASSELNDRIYIITYNILHSKAGKFLLEKILYNQDTNKENKDKIQPNQYNNNSILDVIEGNGAIKAECGDIAEVAYIIRLVDGKEIENTYKKKQPITFQIGERKVIKGLEHALIGMKEGGIRRLIVSPNFAYADSKFSKEMLVGNEFVTIDVELIKLKSNVSSLKDKVKIFDKQQKDTSTTLKCSNEVAFTYKLSTIDEKIISETTEVQTFILGSKMVPDAINAAFSNITSDSNRLIILPASLLQRQKISFLPKNIKLPATGMLMLDVYTFGRKE